MESELCATQILRPRCLARVIRHPEITDQPERIAKNVDRSTGRADRRDERRPDDRIRQTANMP